VRGTGSQGELRPQAAARMRCDLILSWSYTSSKWEVFCVAPSLCVSCEVWSPYSTVRMVTFAVLRNASLCSLAVRIPAASRQSMLAESLFVPPTQSHATLQMSGAAERLSYLCVCLP
jgi:hypothetical protein